MTSPEHLPPPSEQPDDSFESFLDDHSPERAESFEDLNIETGDIVHSKSGRSAAVLETVFNGDDPSDGHIVVELTAQDGKLKHQKLSFQHLIEQQDRIERIEKPRQLQSKEAPILAEIVEEPEAPAEKEAQMLREATLAELAPGQKDNPVFNRYLERMIKRRGIYEVKRVMPMIFSDKKYAERIRKQAEEGNMNHWSSLIEYEFDWQNPEIAERKRRASQDFLSFDDEERMARGLREKTDLAQPWVDDTILAENPDAKRYLDAVNNWWERYKSEQDDDDSSHS